MDYSTLLIIIGTVAIILEIALGAATGFDLLLVGLIFIISGTLGMISHSFPLAIGSITALSFLYIFFGRRFIRTKLSVTTHATNVDALMGKKATVFKAIRKNHAGQVKIEGEIWRATSKKDIDAGREVLIESVSGVTLEVSPIL